MVMGIPEIMGADVCLPPLIPVLIKYGVGPVCVRMQVSKRNWEAAFRVALRGALDLNPYLTKLKGIIPTIG